MYGVESLPRYMEGFSPPCKEINFYKRNQGDVFVTDQVRKVGWGRDQNLPKNDIKLHHPGKRLLENSSALHPVWGTMEKCKLQIARRKLALDGWRNPWGRSQSWKIAANYQMFDIPSTGSTGLLAPLIATGKTVTDSVPQKVFFHPKKWQMV